MKSIRDDSGDDMIAKGTNGNFTGFFFRSEEISRFQSTLSGSVHLGLLDPLLPFLQTGCAPEDRIAQSFPSHENEFATAVFHLAGERDVESARVLIFRRVQLVGRQIFFDSVHPFPLGRNGDEFRRPSPPLGSCRPAVDGLEDGRGLADDSGGPYCQQSSLQLSVIVDGRDGTASHEVAAAKHLQRLCHAARSTLCWATHKKRR